MARLEVDDWPFGAGPSFLMPHIIMDQKEGDSVLNNSPAGISAFPKAKKKKRKKSLNAML
jgi:hypothetical protein